MLFGKGKEKKQLEKNLTEAQNRIEELQRKIPLLENYKAINPKLSKLAEDVINLPTLVDIPFENFLEKIFNSPGYSVERTKKYDNGTDLIVTKNKIEYFIQAKGHTVKNNLITYAEMNDTSVINKYINKAKEHQNFVIITNTYFSEKAKEIAEENNIELIDLKKLYFLIAKLQPMLMAEVITRLDNLENCKKCNNHKLIRINPKTHEEFYGCSNYPYCNYKESL